MDLVRQRTIVTLLEKSQWRESWGRNHVMKWRSPHLQRLGTVRELWPLLLCSLKAGSALANFCSSTQSCLECSPGFFSLPASIAPRLSPPPPLPFLRLHWKSHHGLLITLHFVSLQVTPLKTRGSGAAMLLIFLCNLRPFWVSVIIIF